MNRLTDWQTTDFQHFLLTKAARETSDFQVFVDAYRDWYGHEPEKWPEFKSRYFAELDAHPELIKELLDSFRKRKVTFVYSSKEQNLNNAVALKEYMESIS